MSNWQTNESVKKGNRGEDIVYNILCEKGYLVYKYEQDKRHIIDFVVFNTEVHRIRFVDIKCKPARRKFPDTGFDIKSLEEYKLIMDIAPVYIFWVDEAKKEVYYQDLEELLKPILIKHNDIELDYPIFSKNIVYFPLEKMKHLCKISDEQAKQIRKYSNISEKYCKVNENILKLKK